MEPQKKENFLDLPAQLQALNINQQRGPPKIAPKPRPAPKPKRNPQARVLYDYDAQDNDEISLQEGQIIEVKPFRFPTKSWKQNPNPLPGIKIQNRI